MSDQPVFVLSAGRSGSTLLQKLLNSNRELVIWGEHMGIFKHLAKALHDIERSPWINEDASGTWMLEEHRDLRPERWSAWDGPFSQDEFRASLKAFVDRLFCRDLPEGARWGFKEIRYARLQEARLLLTLYPSARFLMLLRHPVDICASHVSAILATPSCPSCTESTYRTVRKTALGNVKPFFTLVTEMQQFYPGSSMPVFFEDLVEHTDATMNAIRDFLELGQPFEADRLQQVMSYDLVSQRKARAPEEMEEYRRMAHVILAPESAWYERARS